MPNDPSLKDKADAFASELLTLLNATLPGNHRVSIERRNNSFIVHTASDRGQAVGHVPLYAKRGDDKPLASFHLSMSLRPDSTGRYLAVSQSKMILFGIDRTPVVRLEFLDDARKSPCCHWQFHGQNPAFEELLRATRRRKAARHLSALHFPVGGARMRPGIEDFLQFLIQECGFVAVQGWEDAVRASRTQWRLRQARTIARDAPRAVARSLGEHLGVRVLRLSRLSRGVDDVPKALGKW
jgi:hypothetical protein